LWCDSLNSLRRGNWTVDLQAGSEFGYKLLFVILLAGLGAARKPCSELRTRTHRSQLTLPYVPVTTTRRQTVLQVLSLRLGIATSKSLPAQIRALFLRMRDHPKVSPYKWRRNLVMGGLYVLYGLAEVAIIATDLAELLGSAIALNL
jgi:metal iron transporter